MVTCSSEAMLLWRRFGLLLIFLSERTKNSDSELRRQSKWCSKDNESDGYLLVIIYSFFFFRLACFWIESYYNGSQLGNGNQEGLARQLTRSESRKKRILHQTLFFQIFSCEMCLLLKMIQMKQRGTKITHGSWWWVTRHCF